MTTPDQNTTNEGDRLGREDVTQIVNEMLSRFGRQLDRIANARDLDRLGRVHTNAVHRE